MFWGKYRKIGALIDLLEYNDLLSILVDEYSPISKVEPMLD